MKKHLALSSNRNDYMEDKMNAIDAADEAEYNRVQSVLAQRARQDANNAHMQAKMVDVDAAGEAAWAALSPKWEARDVDPNELMCDATDYPSHPQTPDVDLFDLSCKAADAIDPYAPSLEPVGVGDLIDQAAISMPQAPVISALKFFRDRISTGYNIVCQIVQEEGLYYDIKTKIQDAAIKIKEDVSRHWSQLSTSQKAWVVIYLVAATLIAPAGISFLL